MKFSVFQVTRKGGREKNEDRMGYCYTREAGLFLLADGMGGHPEGEVAAQLALQVIAAKFQKEAQPLVRNAAAFFEVAMLAAHRRILRYAMEKGMLDTPRTTIVAALLQGGAVTCVHCGDSRFYLVRDGELLARTRDHSFVEQGKPMRHPPAQAEPSVNRNVLFTCLGSPVKPAFEITGPLSLQQGDKMMLCSDGLWDSMTDDYIAFQLARLPVNQAVHDLVEQALARAGQCGDNVSAIALEWETPTGEPATGRIFTDTISDGVFASTVQSG